MGIAFRLRLLGLTALSIALIGAAGFSSSPLYAQRRSGIIRVATSGSDSEGCGSEAQPCASIGFAITQAANPADASTLVANEIRVAAGTYVGSGTEVALLNRKGTLVLRGGYSTTNWSS